MKLRGFHVLVAVLLLLFLAVFIYFRIQEKRQQEFEDDYSRKHIDGVWYHYYAYLDSANIVGRPDNAGLLSIMHKEYSHHEPLNGIEKAWVGVENDEGFLINLGAASTIQIITRKLEINDNIDTSNIALHLGGSTDTKLPPTNSKIFENIACDLSYNPTELFPNMNTYKNFNTKTHEGLLRLNEALKAHDKKGYIILPSGFFKDIDYEIRLDIRFGVRAQEIRIK